jgi:hypothetical protein
MTSHSVLVPVYNEEHLVPTTLDAPTPALRAVVPLSPISLIALLEAGTGAEAGRRPEVAAR